MLAAEGWRIYPQHSVESALFGNHHTINAHIIPDTAVGIGEKIDIRQKGIKTFTQSGSSCDQLREPFASADNGYVIFLLFAPKILNQLNSCSFGQFLCEQVK